MLESATYYLGGFTWGNGDYDGYVMNTNQYYIAERTNTGSNNPLTWTGNLGLMYPSDYGYASSGKVSEISCRTIGLYSWSNSDNAPCLNNDWLFNSSFWQWTMTPSANNRSSIDSINIRGYVPYSVSFNGFAVRPVAYLKSSVKIIGGTGSSDNPYRLSL